MNIFVVIIWYIVTIGKSVKFEKIMIILRGLPELSGYEKISDVPPYLVLLLDVINILQQNSLAEIFGDSREGADNEEFLQEVLDAVKIWTLIMRSKLVAGMWAVAYQSDPTKEDDENREILKTEEMDALRCGRAKLQQTLQDGLNDYLSTCTTQFNSQLQGVCTVLQEQLKLRKAEKNDVVALSAQGIIDYAVDAMKDLNRGVFEQKIHMSDIDDREKVEKLTAYYIENGRSYEEAIQHAEGEVYGLSEEVNRESVIADMDDLQLSSEGAYKLDLILVEKESNKATERDDTLEVSSVASRLLAGLIAPAKKDSSNQQYVPAGPAVNVASSNINAVL